MNIYNLEAEKAEQQKQFDMISNKLQLTEQEIEDIKS